MTRTLIAAALLSALATTAQAKDWSGAGELGLVISSGNSDTSTINAKLGLKREDQDWVHEANILALRAEGDDRVTAERWEVAAKSGHKINDMSYLYGSYRHEDDNFAPFERQTTVAVGYGRELIKNDATELKFEAGPGYKWVDPVSTEMSSQGELVLRGNADYKRKLNDNVAFYNLFLVESGQDNTFAQNDIGMQMKMFERYALKVGLLARHNTDVAEPIKKTDTLTTVNLVYSF